MFDFDKFEAAQFTVLTKDIPVPGLKEFFPEGVDPVWTVKCLTATEMAIAAEHVRMNKDFEKFVSEFLKDRLTDSTIDDVKEKLGMQRDDEKTPYDIVFRKALLMYGSVPKCPEQIAVKLANVKGEIFKDLTDEIRALSGQGFKLGE